MTPFRSKDTVEHNPIHLPEDYVRRVGGELDAHLASLFVLFHQYQKHHWLVEGPQFRDLHKYLQEAYTQVHLHADALAERMTALGLTPTCHPVEQSKIAYIEHEPEGTFRVRDMLHRDMDAEGELSRRLRDSVRTTRDQDPGTEDLLKTILRHAEDRAHHLHHFLGEDSLEIGLTASADALRG